MAALTTANGVEATKRAAILAGTSGVGDFIDGAGLWGTKLRGCYDTYAMPAGDTAALGVVITMGVVPKGARVLGWVVSNEAHTAAVTADFQLVDAAGNITTASASEAWTSWNGVNQLWIPALEAVSNAGLDAEHTVTITTAAQALVAAKSICVTTLYLAED